MAQTTFVCVYFYVGDSESKKGWRGIIGIRYSAGVRGLLKEALIFLLRLHHEMRVHVTPPSQILALVMHLPYIAKIDPLETRNALCLLYVCSVPFV